MFAKMFHAFSFDPISCSACKPQHCSQVEKIAGFDCDDQGHRCRDGTLQAKTRRFCPGASSRCVVPPPLMPPSDDSASTASAGDESSINDLGDSSQGSAWSVAEDCAIRPIRSTPQFKPHAFEVNGVGDKHCEQDLSSALVLSFLTTAALARQGQHLYRWKDGRRVLELAAH
mmetsp:Transcript_3545/g.5713  ORF Transcript_3545/g.5713 Transcript_3545/m.5713 type:complete len:172 (+) Transcript_3545:69-584(+)